MQQVLADVATEIEAARLLVQRASWMGRAGIPLTGGQGSMSKLKAGDVDVGDPDPDGPRRPARLVEGGAAREVVPGREDLPAVRGNGGDPARVISQMQVEEYRERLAAGAEIAADAVGGTAAAVQTNGDRGAAEGPLPARRRRSRRATAPAPRRRPRRPRE